MRKYLPYIKIFTVEAICMIIELCSSYLSYPYFGNGHSVWVAIIAVVLLSNSIGNIIGGRLSNKTKETGKDYTGLVFAIAALSIGATLVLSDYILPVISAIIPISGLAALVGSLILFMPCAVCFGTIGPQIMYNASQDDDYSGKKTGLIYALSTTGGLTGTLIGGFVLVPLLGCRAILIVCILLTIALSVISSNILKNPKALCCAVTACVCIVMSIASAFQGANWINEEYGYAHFDSEYNRITIANTVIDGHPARTMSMASGFESGTYLDGNKYELIFDYMKKLDELVYKNNNIESKSTLMVGGAAYQFPKYLVTHYTDKNITSVEIDPEVTKLARKYFFINEIENQYAERFQSVNDDGRVFIANTTQKYNVIFNDVFAGKSPVSTLTTIEFVKLVKNALTDNGIYAINIVAGTQSDEQNFLKAEANTVKFAFKHVYLYQIHDNPENGLSNFILIATDSDIQLQPDSAIEFADGLILTDDYCPVESLLPKSLS